METEKARWSLPKNVRQNIMELTPSAFRKQTYIYHEPQKDLLCGRHCLNNLLQYPVFQTHSLQEISHILHASEQSLLGDDEQTTRNSYGSDEDGYFNVQVIDVALKSLNLSLKPFHTGVDLYKERCFLINHLNHWFALRKINGRWYNLDSKSKVDGEVGKPMLIDSADELFMKLAQIMSQSGQIFIVDGEKIPNGSSEMLPGLGSYYKVDEIKSEEYYDKRAEEMEIKTIARALEASQEKKEDEPKPNQVEEIKEKKISEKPEQPIMENGNGEKNIKEEEEKMVKEGKENEPEIHDPLAFRLRPEKKSGDLLGLSRKSDAYLFARSSPRPFSPYPNPFY